jgi:hypothetical protein
MAILDGEHGSGENGAVLFSSTNEVPSLTKEFFIPPETPALCLRGFALVVFFQGFRLTPVRVYSKVPS